MISPLCEKAINEALERGNALLKFISPNDTGATGAHQFGFYLPKSAWALYTPNAPLKHANTKHPVNIEWQDGRITESMVTWYGRRSRSEYRLTRFGKDFPFLMPDTVGDLLVLVPKSLSEFFGYVFDLGEDIEEIMAALGIEPFNHWAIYKNGIAESEGKNDCLEKKFQEFAKKFDVFPSGKIFSEATRQMMSDCFSGLSKMPADDRLLEYYTSEYRLFRVLERQVCQPEIAKLFKDVDDFLQVAVSIVNRRKSRAGRSLENHVDFIFSEAQIPHEMQPKINDGQPDVVIPDHRAYLDSSYPLDKLFVVGIKTTCKDRWRQVLNEARRVKHKHVLTLQPVISSNQLTEMHEAGITLIVPSRLQKEYPKNHPLKIVTVEGFIRTTKKLLAR